MYSSFVIILLLATSWLPLQAQTKTQIRVQLDSSLTPDRVIHTVDQGQPEFPGGMSKLGQYIKENLRYPTTARTAGLTGRVIVRFLINKQGAVERVHVLKGISPELDAEAVRLVGSMPDWIPKKVNGQAVDCSYYIPINFSLE